MAIESNYITAIQHSEDLSTAIEILPTKPQSQAFNNPLNPGRIVGYYNAALDQVELYVVDGNGLRYIPVRLYIP